jgi:hypothetical protein
MGSYAEELPPQDDEITVCVTGFAVCIMSHFLSPGIIAWHHVARSAVA